MAKSVVAFSLEEFDPTYTRVLVGNANFTNVNFTNLGTLEVITGFANFSESQVENLGNLTTIGGDAYFLDSQVENLGNLTTIGQDTNFQFSELKDLGNLITIGGTAVFGQSEIKDLGNLTTIGRDANFYQSQIMDLRNLETIGRNAYFNDSEVKSLGNLRTILGNADFWDSQVENLGNLTTIKGYVNFGDRKDLEAEWEKISSKDNFKTGGQSLSKTPAPKKDQIKGSDKNKPESSKDTKSAEKIEFSGKTLETIKNKVAEHNEKNPKKKVTLASAKAVVRRGMGAYSSTHRPTISGGKPNSRVAWGLARLNAFFYKIINGKSKSGKYSQDNDLIEELGYKVAKYVDGGLVENELIKIKEAYDFGSEYFDGKIYGQEYKIRMNKNHPRNSRRNDDQSIHNLSLVNIEYPSAVVFRENYGKLQYQYDKIYDWENAKEKIEDFFYEIKDRIEDYANGGLIAPNGKPSNLTPEQYKLVRTPAFKKWFGDWENDPANASKVVDENEEPLVVWRGESKDFNVFEYKKLGSTLKTAWRNAGFYFSPTKQGAEQYMYFYARGILKQFFLNIKNPYTLDSKEFIGVMDWGSLPTQRFKTNKSATDFATKRISEIKSANYDGAFVTILENNNVVEIVAFEPNQIKLADGTNTTFDGKNPDIRFMAGGVPKKRRRKKGA